MKSFSDSDAHERVSPRHRAALDLSVDAHHGVYLGHRGNEWSFAGPEHAVLVLGPPRSGKTTSLVIPNVLSANGPVVSTSTKPDVLDATVGARRALGEVHLFDPTGTLAGRGEITALRWSPLQSCSTWRGALSMARALVTVGASAGGTPPSRGDNSHWEERAQSLLAPMLLAAALDGQDMRTLLRWVDRRHAVPAQVALAAAPERTSGLARDLLDGMTVTDDRELSGIWSTASGALAGFRTDEALEACAEPTFDADRFVRSGDTVYVAAPAHLQAQVAPMVVGLLEDVRQATYRRAADPARAPTSVSAPPVLLALDEVANIAPLPDLPAMISEGGGQGLVTMACLQDLSQARPPVTGRRVPLPVRYDRGPPIGATWAWRWAGEEEIATRSVSSGRSATDHPFRDALTGGRPHHGESISTQWRPRLPPDVITRGREGAALAFDHRNRAQWVPLAPSHLAEPWRTLRSVGRSMEHEAERSEPRRDAPHGREPTGPASDRVVPVTPSDRPPAPERTTELGR
jgi:type IV secretion system protein VirD4